MGLITSNYSCPKDSQLPRILSPCIPCPNQSVSSVSSVDFIISNNSFPTDSTDFVSWHPLSYLSVSSVSSVGFIPSTYSCPTDFTDFHRFRLLASLVQTNPCHPCHLWALFLPLILVPRISQISTDFVCMQPLVWLSG